jgi:hypothetical protein
MKWKDIKGYEGAYQISDTGEVKSLPKSWRTCENLVAIRKEKLLSKQLTRKDDKGYYTVRLYKGNTWKTHKIHRLVAEAFISNPDSKPCVNHKDGNKLNNYCTNLEWTTIKENVNHAWDTGLCKVHSKIWNSIEVVCTKTGKVYPSILQAANSINMKEGTLRKKLKSGTSNNTTFIYNQKPSGV